MKRVATGADGLDVRRIDTELLRARKKDNYQETGILSLLDVLAFGEHLILMGDKGTGKTLNVEQWAHRQRVPFMRVSCTGETGDRQLLGGFVLKSLEESWFSLGALASAIDVANECGQCVLVLEEINALNEEAQKTVNSVADYRREVILNTIGVTLRLTDGVRVREGGTVRELEPLSPDVVNVVVGVDDYEVPTRTLLKNIQVGAQVSRNDMMSRPSELWVIGTMNPDYGGTYDLNEDFRSRFQFVRIHAMPDEIEEKILTAQLPGRVSAKETRILQHLQVISKETRGGKLGYVLSTRDLEQCVKAYVRFSAAGDAESLQKALKLMQGKFPPAHAADFAARVRSVFKDPTVDLPKTALY